MATLTARTALITGASAGIGAALARNLADKGVRVALAARREDALRKVADGITAAGGQADVVTMDVSDPEAVQAAMLRADDAMGGIDLVIANAGVGEGRWSGKLDWAHCAKTHSVNVIGATATLTALLPRMVERKAGHLVGISSVAAYRGLPKFAVYSGSKAYLSTFLEAMRVDLRRTGIAVTDVRPGYVRTGMTAGNDRMPFIISAEQAAKTITSALAARKAVHAFPLPIASAMKTMSAVPNAIYDRVMGR